MTNIQSCDNQGCITLAKNSTHQSRTKHIDVQHHFIREKLENQEICLKYCPTEDIIADVLTKPLAKDRHQALTKAMGLKAFDYSQNGSVARGFHSFLYFAYTCVRDLSIGGVLYLGYKVMVFYM